MTKLRSSGPVAIFAIEESVDLAHEVFNLVFRRVPEQVKGE